MVYCSYMIKAQDSAKLFSPCKITPKVSHEFYFIQQLFADIRNNVQYAEGPCGGNLTYFPI